MTEEKTREVPLTRGYVALVSVEDYERVIPFKWNVRIDPKKRTQYAQRNVKRPDGTYTTEKMHRFILNAPKGVEVDHVNNNGLDNTRGNLRLANHAENQQNKGLFRNNTSGYKGVAWHKATGKWQARISIDGKNKHLGLFEDAISAALCYDKAAKEYQKEFAVLNFPEESHD